MHPLEALIILITTLGCLVQFVELVRHLKNEDVVLESSSKLKLSYRDVFAESFEISSQQSDEMDKINTVGKTVEAIAKVYPVIAKSGSIHALLYDADVANDTWQNVISSKFKGAVLTSYQPLNLTAIAVMRKANLMFGFFNCSTTHCELHTSIYYCGTFMEDSQLNIKLRSTIAPIIEYTQNLDAGETILSSLPLIQRDGDSIQLFYPWKTKFVEVPNPVMSTATTRLLMYDVGGAQYKVNKGLETKTSGGSTLVYEKYVFLEPTENNAYIEMTYTQFIVSANDGAILLVLINLILVGTLSSLLARYMVEIFLSSKGYSTFNRKTPAILYELNRNIAVNCCIGLALILSFHYSDYLLIQFYSQANQAWNTLVIMTYILLLQQAVLIWLLPVLRLTHFRLTYNKALVIYGLYMSVPLLVGEVFVLLQGSTQGSLFHRSDNTLHEQIVSSAITAKIGPKTVLLTPGEFKAHIFAEGSAEGTLSILISWGVFYSGLLVAIIALGLTAKHKALQKSGKTYIQSGENVTEKSTMLSDEANIRIRGIYKTCLENSIEFNIDCLYGVFPNIEQRLKAGPYWLVSKVAMMFLGFYILNDEILVDRSFCIFYYADRIGLGKIISSFLSGTKFTVFRIQNNHVDGRSGRIVYYGSDRWHQLLAGHDNIKIEPVG